MSLNQLDNPHAKPHPSSPAHRLRRTDRKLTNRLAERMNSRWTAKSPGISREDLAFSLRFFREVYHRAQLWRQIEHEAGTEQQRVALVRILRQVEVDLGASTRERPAAIIDILLADLRATLWRSPRSRRAAPSPRNAA